MGERSKTPPHIQKEAAENFCGKPGPAVTRQQYERGRASAGAVASRGTCIGCVGEYERSLPATGGGGA